MELDAVNRSYRRWAPIYDNTFGAITHVGRRKAVDYINTRAGRVLEVGVGTGLSLRDYQPHLEIYGFDVSAEMLAKARAKVAREKLDHVKDLRVLDARTLDYPDGHFDVVVAMYLVSVVPEPERVMAEMARVTKPGGEVLLVNHFKRETGFLAFLERAFAPAANLLGWHSDFDKNRVLGVPELELVAETTHPPFGMFSFLKFRKTAAGQGAGGETGAA